MKKDVKNLWEQEGDLERMRIFFKHSDTDNEQKERIKQLVLRKMEQYDYDQINEINQPITNEQVKTVSSDLEHPQRRNTLGKFSKSMKDFTFSRKWGYALSAVLLFFVIFIGKMGIDGQLNLSSKDTDAGTNKQETQHSLVGGSEINRSAEFDSSIAVVPELPQPGQPAPPADDALPRKITYNIYASIQVKDVNFAIEEISGKLENLKGYIVESSVNKYENGSSGHVTLKIPSEKLNDFKNDLPKIGKVMNQNMNANDITNQYYDSEARLRSYKAQEERYLELLNDAKTVEEILNIESHLSNVRVKIEQLQGQLKLWDHEVAYSTAQIDFQTSSNAINIDNPWQPVSWASTWLAAKNAVLKTISSAWNALNYLVVGAAYALPVIFLIGVMITIFMAIKKLRK